MIRSVLPLLLLLCSVSLSAQLSRNWLAGQYDTAVLRRSLQPAALAHEFPAYADRARWESITPVYRERLIREGESRLDYKWQVVPASVYLEYGRSGNRYIQEDLYNENITALKQLAFAELAEGKGRFLPQLIDGAWAVCEISSWSISASINLQKKGGSLPDITEPVIELGAGITANAMAWVYYHFKDAFNKTNPLIARRIKQEIERRILVPYYTRNDLWWMALDGRQRMVNNWNIWLNYNVLTCLLLVEDDPGKQLTGIYKTMRSADQFINYYKEDGACEEGPAYWSHAGGMLYNYLSMLRTATGGAVDLFDKPLVKNIAAYIGKAYIAGNWFLNYADAAAQLHTDPGMVYAFGKATGDASLQQFGAYLAQQAQWENKVPVETLFAGVRNLFAAKEILTITAQPSLPEAVWLNNTGIAVARDLAGSSKGFYFSALAGHNAESHNHNDVGTCVVFYDGQPILIDVGNETYNAQTFGPRRYAIWTMRSAYHNVPLINGVEQHEGQRYAARAVAFSHDQKGAKFSLDIAAAYPDSAAVREWTRSYQLKKQQSFTITDKYNLEKNNGQTALHFMTSAAVRSLRDGVLELQSGPVVLQLQYDPRLLQPTVETVPVKDKLLLKSWPPEIRRIVFRLRSTKLSGSHQLVLRKVS
ncbi:MAG: heparinase II/III family protein [Candidatus Pseudobacter hemicellulosilyticus]|uniref:Heparinase II/III family protein n=1 Tax=Candidatus Pseudobacter hemicellulosilyticus TaxID=3121375 RepID=A0AAJ5WVY2_9BACT|nr:MAG: heparinase II/III family protein [Pseudobacter sp.]